MPGKRLNSLEVILAFSFGTVFCFVLLGLSFFVQNPSDLAIFVTRVVLSLAAAGIGAVLPGLLDVRIDAIPGLAVRAGGAFALGVLVYLVNPPELVSKEKEVKSALFDVQISLARGNLDWEGGRLSEISYLLPKNCADVTYLQGVIDRKKGQTKSAELFLERTLELLTEGKTCFVELSRSEVLYQIGLLYDIEGRYDLARAVFSEIAESESSATTILGDSLFERARLGLLVLMTEGGADTEKSRYLARSIDDDFRAFLDGDWPGINRKHWAKYHLSCLSAYLLNRGSDKDEHASVDRWMNAFFLTWRT